MEELEPLALGGVEDAKHPIGGVASSTSTQPLALSELLQAFAVCSGPRRGRGFSLARYPCRGLGRLLSEGLGKPLSLSLEPPLVPHFSTQKDAMNGTSWISEVYVTIHYRREDVSFPSVLFSSRCTEPLKLLGRFQAFALLTFPSA